LGNIDFNELKQNEPVEVEIIKISIMCPTRPQGDINFCFDKSDSNTFDKKKEKYYLKEGTVNQIRILFKVRYDLAIGLRWVNIVKRMGLQVDKYEEILGTYAPLKDVQYVDIIAEEVPKGFFSRGKYLGKAMIVDAKGIVHMQYEYKFEICKDWKDSS